MFDFVELFLIFFSFPLKFRHNGTNYLPFGDLGGGFVRSIVRDSNSGVLYAGGNFFVRGVRTYLGKFNKITQHTHTYIIHKHTHTQ